MHLKLGMGLYQDMLNKKSFQFARQANCTHIVAHLTNYYTDGSIVPATDDKRNYGNARYGDEWSLDHLIALRKSIESEGLRLHAIENFNPASWYDILLDGPQKQQQMDGLKTIIRNVGKAGIPVFGYNFSIAGVWGHERKPLGRGGADSTCFFCESGGKEYPIPNGQIWNMTYDQNAAEGFIPPISHQELWDRWTYFINEILPVAEESNVQMAAHPDDPPMPEIRGHARLVYQPRFYQKMLDINPSLANGFELCLGSMQEMTEGNIYDFLKTYAPQNRLGYIHFRNVRGKVPHYIETFLDDGDIDMVRCLRILKECNYEGVLIPDHTPQMSCDGSWFAGMAFALGYMVAAMRMVEEEF